jgi:hypothetical protein
MDRRYYLAKASIVAVAVALTLGALQTPWATRRPMQDAHYRAAVLMQASVRASESRIGASLRRLIVCTGHAAISLVE